MTKAQHSRAYGRVPLLLKAMRQEAKMTQRALGRKLGKPQSWVHNCETANRRVDVAEFRAWCKACGMDPSEGFAKFLDWSE